MFNRWIGIISAACMICASTALIYRDIAPTWLAGDPPDPELGLLSGRPRRVQVGIFDDAGRLIGRSWTVARRAGISLDVRSWTVLRPITLPNNIRTPLVRIDTSLVYHQQTRVDKLTMRLHGLPTRIELTGKFYPPNEFPCEWRVGSMTGQFLLDAEATRALGDVVRPFDRLPGLYVGRTWRLKLFNPLANVLPGWKAADVSDDRVLVRVTARESIEHDGRQVDCFRVETDRATAWVNASGRVLKQVVDIPLLGRLTLLDQPFDQQAHSDALTMFSSDP